MTSSLIVILNWNGIEDTLKSIDSLLKQTYKQYDILVVDNGSVDNSISILESLVAENNKLHLIKNSSNLGFAGGVNTGISYSIKKGYDTVALFNNDAVADKEWLKELIGSLSTNVSISTGLLLTENGKNIDSTAEMYSIWGMPFPRSRGKKVESAPDSNYIFGATGGATLYKTSLFKEIGLFDESFFAYYEDVDISFRAQLAGHKIFYNKKAIAYHKQGATSKKIPGFTVYQTFKNIPLLYIKNIPNGLLIPVGFRLFFLYWLIFGNAIKNGSGTHAFRGWLAGVWYFWTKAFWSRFYIQARKAVSTSYIKSLLWEDLPPEQTGLRKLRKILTGK